MIVLKYDTLGPQAKQEQDTFMIKMHPIEGHAVAQLNFDFRSMLVKVIVRCWLQCQCLTAVK